MLTEIASNFKQVGIQTQKSFQLQSRRKWEKLEKMWEKVRDQTSVTRQGNGENVAGLDAQTPHRIHSHNVGDRGVVPAGDGGDGVPLGDDIGQVNRGEAIVGGVEASAREGYVKGLAGVEVARVGDAVGVRDLVGGNEAGVDGGGDGGDGVGGAGAVAGEVAADAVPAGAGREGDLEEEAGGEDVVVDVGEGDVEGVGSEEGDGVDLEEGGELGDLERGVEGVSGEGEAGVGAGAGLNGRLAGGRARGGDEDEEDGDGRRRRGPHWWGGGSD